MILSDIFTATIFFQLNSDEKKNDMSNYFRELIDLNKD